MTTVNTSIKGNNTYSNILNVKQMSAKTNQQKYTTKKEGLGNCCTSKNIFLQSVEVAIKKLSLIQSGVLNSDIPSNEMNYDFLENENIPDLINELKSLNKSAEHLQKSVCEHFDITLEELKSKNRERPLVTYRQISCYIIHHCTATKLKQNGHIHGGRDHATIIHSKRIVNDFIDYEKGFDKTVKIVLFKLIMNVI